MKEMDTADHYLICLFAGWVDVVCPPADHFRVKLFYTLYPTKGFAVLHVYSSVQIL